MEDKNTKVPHQCCNLVRRIVKNAFAICIPLTAGVVSEAIATIPKRCKATKHHNAYKCGGSLTYYYNFINSFNFFSPFLLLSYAWFANSLFSMAYRCLLVLLNLYSLCFCRLYGVFGRLKTMDHGAYRCKSTN